MDISKVTDSKELESLAYQQIKTINIAQANLQALEARIAELSKEPAQE